MREASSNIICVVPLSDTMLFGMALVDYSTSVACNREVRQLLNIHERTRPEPYPLSNVLGGFR